MRTLDKVTTTGQRQTFALTMILALVFVIQPTQAQLAITEVMSASTNRFGPNLVVPGPDWWELSNFGASDIDLTGYRFNDNQGGINQADTNAFQGLVIKRGESIVFFESPSNLISADAFRAWWGIGANVRVIAYTNDGYGLSGQTGDSVLLWGPAAANEADVVDSVDFGPATDGNSFTYDSVTGEFGVLSAAGIDGAFSAATADDVGSPGTNVGPVRISVAEQPVSVVANPGDTVTFSVRHRGLPRPKFQWYHGGNPISDARYPSYTVGSVQFADAGNYYVVLSNIFQVVTSATAILTVSTNPVPPRFIVSPTDLWVFTDQEAIFRAVATGLPQPAYQWRFNGTNIAGATDRTLVVPAPHAVGTNLYSVVASNPLGSVTNAARLIVTERPDLRITELMAREMPSPGTNHDDWWELTNFGTNAVDLFGYRFDDFTVINGTRTQPRLEFAFVITNHVIIVPRESIVFVASMTADEFRRWWGWANLPPALQVITYPSGGYGFSGSSGDGVGLWNMGAVRDDDFVNRDFTLVSYSGLDVSNPNVIGVSFTVNPDTADNLCCYLLSEAGVNGAFVAAESGDIGSPGYIRTPTDPRILSIRHEAEGCRLVWRALAGRSYTLQWRTHLDSGDWMTLTTGLPAVGASMNYLDVTAISAGQRFYRVMVEP